MTEMCVGQQMLVAMGGGGKPATSKCTHRSGGQPRFSMEQRRTKMLVTVTDLILMKHIGVY